MHAIYAFGIFVLLALLGTRFLYRGKNPFSPLYILFQSGLVYVFLGVYLGQQGVNILSPQILQGFRPIIGLGLGWIGFLFGFQLEYRYLKRFPRKYLSLSFLSQRNGISRFLNLHFLPISCAPIPIPTLSIIHNLLLSSDG